MGRGPTAPGRTRAVHRVNSTLRSGARRSASSCWHAPRVVRLGATVVSSDADLSIPTATPAVDFRGPGVPPAAPPGAAAVEQLSPREWRLEAWISIPNPVFRSLEENPELAQTLKADLAEALARRADEAFLSGPPKENVAARAAPVPTAGSLLETARDVVSAVRAAEAEFHSPGWILHPSTLDALTSSTTTNGLVPGGAQPRSLDSLRLLTLDGVDGGALLGYPFATSTAAGERLFFAADWRQAYVCVAETPVTVDTPVAPAVRRGRRDQGIDDPRLRLAARRRVRDRRPSVRRVSAL